MSLSMVDVAYQILSDRKRSMKFPDLWKHVCMRIDLNPTSETSRMSQFFTNLSLDNRFALVNDLWDIRARHKLAEVIIDTSTLALDEDEEEEVVIDEERGYDDSTEEDDE